MTQDFLEELNPVEKDGDIGFDPDAEPALAPSNADGKTDFAARWQNGRKSGRFMGLTP
jgi:hypothetical protein